MIGRRLTKNVVRLSGRIVLNLYWRPVARCIFAVARPVPIQNISLHIDDAGYAFWRDVVIAEDCGGRVLVEDQAQFCSPLQFNDIDGAHVPGGRHL